MPKKMTLGIFAVLLLFAACQTSNATPTLQPGKVEVPFETVVLDDEGWIEITKPPQVYTISSVDEISQLQDLIEPTVMQQIQQVSYDTYNVLALFRVPGGGCSGDGVTIDRLVYESNVLTIFATDWELREGACGETNLSAYHVVKLSKADVNFEVIEIFLQIESQERKGKLQQGEVP